MYNSVWMLPLSINFVTKPCCFSDICFRNRFVYKSWLEVIIFCFIGKGKVNRNLWALTQSLLLENKRWFLTKVFGEFQGINFDQGLVCYTFLPFSTQIMYFFLEYPPCWSTVGNVLVLYCHTHTWHVDSLRVCRKADFFFMVCRKADSFTVGKTVMTSLHSVLGSYTRHELEIIIWRTINNIRFWHLKPPILLKHFWPLKCFFISFKVYKILMKYVSWQVISWMK